MKTQRYSVSAEAGLQPANSQDRRAALDGLLVVDFTHVISGPFATQMLGDLGARVIKIESAGGDMGRHIGPMVQEQSHYFLCFNRNKESVVLDLKSAEGKAIALALMRQADIVVENFAAGVMDRLGLGYRDVADVNPGLIYCSISGFGSNGPLAEKRSFDLITQAYSGALSANGDPSGPPVKIGVPIGDTTGSLFAVIAILAAVVRRKDTGEGQKIDLALFDCLLATLANHAGHYFATGAQPVRTGSHHYFCVPNGIFQARDGFLAIAVTNDEQWTRLCAALNLQEHVDSPQYATMAERARRRNDVNEFVSRSLATMTVAEAVERLDRAAVPNGPVNDIARAFKEPQVAARHMEIQLSHEKYGVVRAAN